jgi:cysteinyl-tRNA synthetase
MTLKLTNTLTGKKELFDHNKNTPVKLYVCGITPYDYAHIGHGRVYTSFDVLVRLLIFLGHTVTYIRNITDVEDKLINKAKAAGNAHTFKDIASLYFSYFKDEMTALGCLPPAHEPRATECIAEIIAFIQGLIRKDHAYVVGKDVYFDISSFPSYGKLSKRNLDDMQAGARVDVNKQKRSPADFALWKSTDDEVFWDSPWGKGRPGWHIECSVMAQKYLGETLDIHAGGMDLIFPHHENEIAQSEALHGKTFAHTWLHNAFVNINKEKMSKSLGNIISLKSLLEKKDPMVLRYFYLQHHYRTPIDYADSDLDAAQTAYKKLINTFKDIPAGKQFYADYTDIMQTSLVAQDMLEALYDDLNTPKFLGVIFENLTTFKQNTHLATLAKTLLTNVLGFTLNPLGEKIITITPEIQMLIDERQQARLEKNWARSDALRDQLARLGYIVNDKKA